MTSNQSIQKKKSKKLVTFCKVVVNCDDEKKKVCNGNHECYT
jgi:hypothetical protein